METGEEIIGYTRNIPKGSVIHKQGLSEVQHIEPLREQIVKPFQNNVSKHRFLTNFQSIISLKASENPEKFLHVSGKAVN